MFKSNKTSTVKDYYKKIDKLNEQIRQYNAVINILSNETEWFDYRKPKRLLARRRDRLVKIRTKLFEKNIKPEGLK